MTVIIQGDGTKPVPTSGAGVRQPIASTTNATPVAVTMASPHGYLSGDTVDLEGTGIVDGTWIITVTGASAYTLNNSTAPGSTSTTGYAIDYEVQPAFQIPSPGELASMRTMGAVFQGLTNATPWLYRRAGTYRLFGTYSNNLPAAPTGQPWTGTAGNAWWAQIATLTGATVSTFTAIVGGGDATLTTLDFLANNGPTSFAPMVQVNDVLDFEFNVSVYGTNGNGRFIIYPRVNTGFGTVSVPGLGVMYDMYQAAGLDAAAAALKIGGSFFVSNASNAYAIGLAAQADKSTTTIGTLKLIGPASLVVRHFRPN